MAPAPALPASGQAAQPWAASIAAAEDLAAAADRLLAAARRAGMVEDTPLGDWSAASAEALNALAGAMAANARTMSEGLAAIERRDAARSQELRAAIALCEAQVRKGETALLGLAVASEDLKVRTVGEVAAELGKALNKHMVIRQASWNKSRFARAVMAATGVVALWTGAVWWAARLDGRADAAAVAACTRTMVQDKPTGRWYCPVDALEP